VRFLFRGAIFISFFTFESSKCIRSLTMRNKLR
jgi:hypothetical protein